jgi:hypothetical protein
MISKILQNRGDHKTLKKHSITRFIQRHLELKTGKTRPLDVKRLLALDSIVIKRFFSEFNGFKATI